jgi:glycosyltransferase involved in cell wall biosynthesis
LAPWKGQHVALRALAELPEAACVIAGSALFGEDDYARSLHKLASDFGLVDRVRFLGHRDDVPSLMRGVDAVVHPSIDPEPFGRTLVEAMLARRPVVAANAGAVPEILDDGKAGWLVPPNDPVALAAALRRIQAGEGALLLDPAEARARGLYSAGRMQTAVQGVVAEVAGMGR